MHLLFQGDSITDADRLFYPEYGGYGYGYVGMIAKELVPKGYKITNKGCNGNRAQELIRRWDRDCIRLDPDVVTILIGANEVWTGMDGGEKTSPEQFRENLEFLITETIEKTGARIILMEPFVFPYPAERLLWRPQLDEEIQAVRYLARKYKTGLVCLDGIFAKASIRYSFDELTPDGVHLTKLGHQILKDAWLEELLK
jgi:lysophospholipase L1-like esterase